jgi:hypothetical protein
MTAADELFRVLSIFNGNCKMMVTNLESDDGRRGLKLERPSVSTAVTCHRYK